MKYVLKQNIWKNNIELLGDGQIIGKIEKNGFLRPHSKGYFLDRNYTFLVKGIFDVRTEIRDENDNLIGEIYYSTLSSKTKIDLNGKRYYWQSDNFLCTKWKLTDELGRAILLNKNKFIIDYDISEDDDLVIFLATYLFYYSYNQIVAHIV